MSTSAQQLDPFFSSEDFKSLPMTLALEEGILPWWRHMEKVAHYALHCTMLEVLVAAQEVFETYGDNIETIKVRWDISQERQNVYLNSYLRVNGESVHSECNEMEEATQEALDAVDEQKSLHNLCAVVEDSTSLHFLDHTDFMSDLFGEGLKSAKQCQAALEKIDGKVRASMHAWVLENASAHAQPNRPKPRV